jgi:hypothetical protein
MPVRHATSVARGTRGASLQGTLVQGFGTPAKREILLPHAG